MCATGSPFPPVVRGDRTCVIGQANNSFIFPGVGLGAIVAGARIVRDADFIAAARTLAGMVGPDRLSCGALYPPVSELRTVSRAIAIAVVRGIGTVHGVPLPAGEQGEAVATTAVDAATWWPDYPLYEPA
jgi:malic enzyme